jgi:hypothetical protein
MFHLVYSSTATHHFSEEELADLLAESRRWNIQDDITGLLLYHNASFVQILEGPEANVRRMFSRIVLDPRHRHIVTVIEETIEHREFADWTMAFRVITDANSLPEGYSEFLNTPFSGWEFTKNPGRCQKLLLAFKSLL